MVPRLFRDRPEAAARDREEVCVADPPCDPVDDLICGENGDGTTLTIRRRDAARKRRVADQAFHIEPIQQKVGDFLFYTFKQADNGSEEYLIYPMPFQLAWVKTVTPAADGIVKHTTYTVQWYHSNTGYSGKWCEWRRAGFPKGRDLWPPEHITHAQVVIGNVWFKGGKTTKDNLDARVLRNLQELQPHSRYDDFVTKTAQTKTLLAEKTERAKSDLEGETDADGNVQREVDIQAVAGCSRVKAPRPPRPEEWVEIGPIVVAALKKAEGEESEEEESEKEESDREPEGEDSEEEEAAPAPKRRPGKAPVVESSEDDDEPEEPVEPEEPEEPEDPSAESDSSVNYASSWSAPSSENCVDSGSDEGMYGEVQEFPPARVRKSRLADGHKPVGGGADRMRALG
jgi:hypothetical protein